MKWYRLIATVHTYLGPHQHTCKIVLYCMYRYSIKGITVRIPFPLPSRIDIRGSSKVVTIDTNAFSRHQNVVLYKFYAKQGETLSA